MKTRQPELVCKGLPLLQNCGTFWSGAFKSPGLSDKTTHGTVLPSRSIHDKENDRPNQGQRQFKA